jgi:hypothetical protein
LLDELYSCIAAMPAIIFIHDVIQKTLSSVMGSVVEAPWSLEAREKIWSPEELTAMKAKPGMPVAEEEVTVSIAKAVR